jgi:hypothetical protein
MKNSIIIITLDDLDNIQSKSESDPGAVTLPVTALATDHLPAAIADRIYIRSDWPPIGSPDFADQLRQWHKQHNAAA